MLSKWIFQSMTTVTKSQREEITIVYKDENNIETLSFDYSGKIMYNVMNHGVKKLDAACGALINHMCP